MAANAMSFVTKVISIKSIRGKLFVTVDGSTYNVKPTFHKSNLPYQIIKKNDSKKRETFTLSARLVWKKITF